MGTRKRITYRGRIRIVEFVDEDGNTVGPPEDSVDDDTEDELDSTGEDSDSIFD